MTSNQATLDRAIKLQHRGELNEASILLEQFLHIQPNDAEALHLLGIISYQMNRISKAIWFISKAIEYRS